MIVGSCAASPEQGDVVDHPQESGSNSDCMEWVEGGSK